MTKKLTGDCTHCGMPLVYPAEAIGTVTTCPHCGRPTELRLATPPMEPIVPRKALVYTCIALILLLTGVVGTLLALKKARQIAGEKPPPAAQP
jgi:predicted RNA-binding Zn-ribbon protein involved in translation (DUF1610 family)